MKSSRRRASQGRTAGVLVIAALVVVSIWAYYEFSKAPPEPKRTSLVVEEESQPDTLDPAVTYVTQGWEVVEQIYQGLVTYNGTSYTTYQGVLAENWSISGDGMSYTFSLRRNVAFSNGDPLNAYVVWFSVYRTLVMNQAPAWILGQNLAAGNGVTFSVTDSMLNSIDYADPSPENLTVMMQPDQSVQVIDLHTVQFNLGYGYNGFAPYSEFLATLTTPMAMAVDPAFVLANGGVVADSPNAKMQTSTLGTGFYKLQSWVQGQSITLVKNEDYWADELPESQLNHAISPAILDTIIIYYKTVAARIADLQSRAAQIIMAPVTYYNVTKAVAGVNTIILPPVFGAAAGVYYLYMDPLAFEPFNDITVRKAIAYGVDYETIIHVVFEDHAMRWIGPVPLGFPYYDEATAGLSPHQYDPAEAAVLLAQAGYVSHLPNGTTLNPDGQVFPTISFLYDSDSDIDRQVAEIVKTNLKSMNIEVTLSPLPFDSYSTLIFSPSSTDNPYPMGIGFYSEDYTASIDYVYYFTCGNYLGTSSYLDSDVVDWTTTASTSSDPETIILSFRSITQRMQEDYIDIWLYVPDQMAVNQDDVTGMIPNPAGSGAGYFLFYNTVHYID